MAMQIRQPFPCRRPAHWGISAGMLFMLLESSTPIFQSLKIQLLRVQFRAEFFNIFNHPNFGPPNFMVFLQGPNGGQLQSDFGKITSTLTNPRHIQFDLKLIF
jgi:hypothetical protein